MIRDLKLVAESNSLLPWCLEKFLKKRLRLIDKSLVKIMRALEAVIVSRQNHASFGSCEPVKSRTLELEIATLFLLLVLGK
jgi:hypothetical protein